MRRGSLTEIREIFQIVDPLQVLVMANEKMPKSELYVMVL
jgi:hypothetical protein